MSDNRTQYASDLVPLDPLWNAKNITNVTYSTHFSNTTLSTNTNNHNNNGFSSMSSKDLTANLMALGWLFVFWYCCCFNNGRRVPGPEYWRGAQMRRQYQEFLAQERAKEERESQTPEYRHRLVTHNMRTKRVISQDAHGNWTLGNVVETGANSATSTSASPSSSSPSPEYPTSSSLSRPTIEPVDDNQEDYACVICLDSFQVGDIVSWSRCSEDCHHVFHADCIGPWLQGKRQDDCPSCRNRIIIEEPPTEPSSSTATAVGTATSGEPGNSGDIIEPVEREEDSLFVIVRGLISRAAKQASRYTLVSSQSSGSSKSSSADDDDEMQNCLTNRLPLASPLRRVASHDPRPSPPTMIMGRRGANLTPTLASSPVALLSIHNFLPSSSSSLGGGSIMANPGQATTTAIPSDFSFESDDGSMILNGTDLEAGDDTIFRRVQSDIGASPAARAATIIISPNVFVGNASRRYPMMRSRTKVPTTVLQQGGGGDGSLHDETYKLAPTTMDDIFRRPRPVTPTADPEGGDDEDEENDDEDELQWITSGHLPASPSRDPSTETSKGHSNSVVSIPYGDSEVEEQH